MIDQPQARYLDRILAGDELQQVALDATGPVLEAGVAVAEARDVAGFLDADWQRRRCPQNVGLAIQQVERLADRIRYRIVGPRCQLVLAAVGSPRVAGA